MCSVCQSVEFGAICSPHIKIAENATPRRCASKLPFTLIGPNILALRLLNAETCQVLSCKLRGWPEWDPSRIVRSELDREEKSQIVAEERCSLSLVGLENDAEWSAVFAALQTALILAAEHKWCFYNYGLSDPEVVKYAAGGFFRPHRDRVGPNDPRLLTAVAFLNDNYEGGRLRFHLRSKLEIAPEVGTVVVFPADYIHESTPVSCGEKFVGVQCLFKRPTQLWLRRGCDAQCEARS